jgi:DNA primase large subunit
MAKAWFAIQASAVTKTVNKCTQRDKDINERIFTPSLQELCTNIRKFV